MRLVIPFTFLASCSALAVEVRVEFNRDIRPILAAKCYACHGPDEDKREADLRLDVRAEAVKAAIKPGKPEASELWKRITHTDPADVMPPPSSPKQLTNVERDLFRRWIAEGAEYQNHWAFEPIKRPVVPKSDSKNPIDAFIEAKLRAHDLKPAPAADPIALIRRVYLDLTGLPPVPADLAALSGWSDQTYEQIVDRLLASPNFGERWARHWLDMARYADSNGFLGDGLRPNAYLYRDWVIQAFNTDLPFDQFTVQQIAGDLLPDPALEQLTATGFHRNAALNTEAGVDKEEARYQNIVDRVNTTGRVWMGLTVGCAQCHTHKYDPITIRDYYSFYAFFDNTEDRSDSKIKALTLTEVSKDRRQTYVHMAGDYTRRGPDVIPASLSALPPMTRPVQPEPNRLDLARWLVSPQHPLTSRVAVNHIWSKLLGFGFVRTPDDFGTAGESPSHPELLDWLATEFMRNGWSRKHLIKLIVMSATYRQSSAHREDIVELDPLNCLLARQNRIRLDAEILRDSALAVSGLLKRTIGGPSFRPPLPEDVFDVGRSSNWKASPGDEIYRRSLYIITLRSVLYPTLTTFDSPDAADACVRRERSNTPLQALAMMNDSVFVEAAQALALRAMHESPPEVAKRLRLLFKLTLNRPPRAEELQRLAVFHREQKARVEKNGAKALQVLGNNTSSIARPDQIEAATLVAVARVLMNLDEFINRE
ncbi:MAG: PSD1 and planctomycete cytochrome C domain-containing protein [Prosthecobacter sp.]|uniref:PSD1 and planctomycete cytochrome C domain-containing protein n=1 Tax=Prosthecobacter sp. TaxID=1965333 RepID=UPI0025CCDD1F|nr:PSD1 and planctomycete cytochrome C domain-containing protein [Prosthecobacter sp.]MCF7784593.1 PSD1 and planctomycete cytochrome C domain-containing protein [Prosthecobacter sp.]